MRYVPLYIKTENSLLHSTIRIKELIAFARKNNISVLTITDDNMFGAMEFYKACLENSIEPIIGLECMVSDKKIILYAKHFEGYKNLLKLSTIQSERLLEISDLTMFMSDLICIIPFNSLNIVDTLPVYENIYFGYSNEDEYNNLVHKYSNVVYMRETLYLEKSDKKYLYYLDAIREGKLLSDYPINSVDNSLTLPNEVSYPGDCNQEIASLCALRIEFSKDLLPVFDCADGYNSYSYLRHLCKEGLKKRFGSTVNKIYIERLQYELEIINQMGFCNYFLVVWDYVKYAKENGILVGPGRGSAAGSLVSYCLFITDIDPIQYNLLFERFLNPERVTMPDIDIDFEDTRRDEVIEYCVNKYGKKRVAEIITFGTLGAKQVVRDVGRVMDLPLSEIDFLCRMIDTKYSLEENYKNNSKIKVFLDGNKDLQTLYKVSVKLEGIKRHTSVHAAGIVMCNYDIDEFVPLYKHENMYLTAYSMGYLEELGLLKMDFLSLTTLGTISNILSEIRKDGISISFDNIPLNDAQALKVFHDVNTTGIFQFESAGMMNFLRKFKPDSFEDIFAALALYRPGPMDNIDTYIKRKHGKEKIDYLHPDLMPILKPTYGILVYQEQIMQVANIMAGYTLGEADVLRRAMSKKKEDILLKEKDKFIKRAIAKGYDEKLATNVYELVLKFAAYGFNRSHSVAYAVVSYKLAYLKAHYPLYFMKSMLTMAIGSVTNTKKYIYECKKNNIEILKPSISKSLDVYAIEDNKIRYPLTNIKSIGENVAITILKEREKTSFKSIYDFIKRVYGKAVNKKIITNLIWAGCFEEFGFNKKTLAHNLDLILNYGELIQDLDEEYALEPELEIIDEYSSKECMEHELEIYGFYLSNHPITDYKLKYDNIVALENLENYFDKIIHTIVYVDHLRKVSTKKNDMMCFITGSDEIMRVDVTLFPKTYEKVSEQLKEGNIIYIIGRVEKRFDKLQIVVQDLKILE